MVDGNIFLVEGRDDQYVIFHLAKRYGVEGRFEIKAKNSVSNLLDTLKQEFSSLGSQALGDRLRCR